LFVGNVSLRSLFVFGSSFNRLGIWLCVLATGMSSSVLRWPQMRLSSNATIVPSELKFQSPCILHITLTLTMP
jgi:hypothetical protein